MDKPKRKVSRKRGGNDKVRLLAVKQTNVSDDSGKTTKVEILRVLKNPAAEKLLEKKSFPLFDAVSAGLYMKKTLNLSWGELLKEANNLRKQAIGIGSGQRGLGSAMRFAVGGRLFATATVDGDCANGILMMGQTAGRIKDVPSVATVLERTVKEAEEIMQTMNKQFASCKVEHSKPFSH